VWTPLATWIAFVGISLLVICTPGPDTALTVRNVLTGGRRAGLLTAAGVATGQAVWTVAAALGLTGLILASEPGFVAMKLLGFAFLVFLGAQSLLAAWRGHQATSDRELGSVATSGVGTLWQGLFNDLANPKMAAFFVSMLPQFVPSGSPPFATMLAFGLTFSLLTFGWLALYSIAISRLRRRLERSAVRRVLDAVAGTVLVAFGIRLATATR
jgi:threonine/homoserine/homoserine lactone efflux protein